MLLPRLFRVALVAMMATARAAVPSPVVDTGQCLCYDNTRPVTPPEPEQPFFGQDAQYRGHPARYTDHGDGTVSDDVTGLMWSRAVAADKMTLAEARQAAAELDLGGYHDWRVPTIKELYSLIDFRGRTGFSGRPEGMFRIPTNAIPFINTDYFDFRFGDTRAGERFIDAQWLSSTEYPPGTMGGMPTLFGVNFADGRIKGYGLRDRRGGTKRFYVRYVRGRNNYGHNDFHDNDDGTVTDRATGLTWTQADNGRGLNWEDTLAWAENLELGGYDDWRLPNAKELQSIVDYTRSPEATGSPAINPVFACTPVRNEAGQGDWPYYWTSTTHEDGPGAWQAVYLSFGRAIGQMHGQVMDVHGAGAQRSDPKTGSAQIGHGPQGDAQRVLNFVRAVRGGAELVVSPTCTDKPGHYPETIYAAGRERQPTAARYDAAPGTGGMGPPSGHPPQLPW